MSSGRKKTITINEIANELAISASTVSRALNNNSRISNYTKERVWKMAREKGYQSYLPDFVRIKAPSKVIGMVVTNQQNILYTETYRVLQAEALKKGYYLMLFNTHHNSEIEKQILCALKELNLSGLIISISESTTDYSHIMNIVNSGIPVIGINRVNFEIPIPRIIIDYFQGAYSATSHLLTMGCRNIALMIGNRTCQINSEIIKGYKNALAKFGIALRNDLIISSSLSEMDVDYAIDNLFSIESKPEGIITVNPNAALQITSRLSSAGINIPEKLALVLFGNHPLLKWWTPSITCIETDAVEFAKTVSLKFFESLNCIENGKPIPVDTQIIPTLLSIRGSSMKK